jgi:hypothetical protein
MSSRPIEIQGDGGFDLDATAVQIILYGLAHRLRSLHMLDLGHQGVSLANAWLDDNNYLILLKIWQCGWWLNRKGVVTGQREQYVAPWINPD